LFWIVYEHVYSHKAAQKKEKKFTFLLPTVGGRGITFFWLCCLAVHPSMVCQNINTYFVWSDVFLPTGGISWKFDTNIYRVSWHCWRGFRVRNQRIRSWRSCVQMSICNNGGAPCMEIYLFYPVAFNCIGLLSPTDNIW